MTNATEKTTENPIVFWGHPDDENLMYEGKEDALDAIIERLDPAEVDHTTEVEVVAFQRMEVKVDADSILERELEHLDDEYSGEGGPTDPTCAMKEAAKEFAAVLKREYVPWWCEWVPGTKETVNVYQWIQENRLDWLLEEAWKGARK